MNIPTTREEAIEMLVAQDVEKWGEAEREASRVLHRRSTYGLALNTLASRAELAGKPDPELRAAADEALTDVDHRALRQGG